MILESLTNVLAKNGLMTAFLMVGLLVWFSYWVSEKLTRGKLHGSAIAIALGLLLAYSAGAHTGGSQGLADIGLFAGVGILGGAMFRDFAIVATAFGADLQELKRAGAVGAASVIIGVVLSFFVGAIIAIAFGYTDPVSVATIGAGAATSLRRRLGCNREYADEFAGNVLTGAVTSFRRRLGCNRECADEFEGNVLKGAIVSPPTPC